MIETDLSKLGSTQKPYFATCMRGGHIATEGVAKCQLGAKLAVSHTGIEDGVFVEWSWDGDCLRVRNDRYGMYPLFYACTANGIRISPSLVTVLRADVSRDLDYEALAVFFRMGHFIADDTPFRAIRTLPPASTLTWQAGRLNIQTGSASLSRTAQASFGFDAAVDRYIELMERAIQKRLPEGEDFTVPLSGGRDSRHVLFALDKFSKRPNFCPTIQYRPPSTGQDMRIAGLICSEMGIEHKQLARCPSWFESVLKDVHLTDFCAGGHSWVLPLAAYLKGRCTTVYDGLAGSVISGGFKVDERRVRLYADGKFEALAVLILAEADREGFHTTVLRREIRTRTSKDIAVARIIDELRKHADASNPMLSFIFWNRTRRGVSSIPFSILSDVPTVHCPYLDHELFDFLTSIDPSFSLGNQLHDEAIRRGYPQYAHIPYEDKSIRARLQDSERCYYREGIKAFGRYLMRRGFKRSRIIRDEFIYARVLLDLCRSRNELAWYLPTTVHALELEGMLPKRTDSRD